MEAGVLVIRCALFIVLAAAAGLPLVATSAERQEIRFYKANKQLQTDRIWFTRKKGKLPGCHDFLKKTRVYKVVQFGFESCTLYAKKECAADSVIKVSRYKEPKPTGDLTQGYGWLPISEHKKGAKIRSWHCKVTAS